MGIFDVFSKLGGTDPDPDMAQPMTDVSNDAFNTPVADQSNDQGFTAAAPMPSPTITPPAQKTGIAGLLSHAGHFLNDENPATGSSFADRLGLLGAHLQDISDGGERAAPLQARMDAAKRGIQVNAMADKLGLTPMQRFLLHVSPEKFAETLADQQKFHTLGKSDSIVGTNAAGGHTFTPAPVTPSDDADSDAKDAAAAAKKLHDDAVLAETTRHNKAMEGIGTTRAGKMKDGNKAPAGGGGFGPSPAVMSALDAAIRAKGGH